VLPTASDDSSSQYGIAVAISGFNVVVGDGKGAAHVFRYDNNTSWTQVAMYLDPEAPEGMNSLSVNLWT